MTAGPPSLRRALACALFSLLVLAALTSAAPAAAPMHTNPLAIRPAPPASDPLVGARYFVYLESCVICSRSLIRLRMLHLLSGDF
ncbi:MAG TPA: hypothetical protein VG294_07305 [Solirubrobacteraceae bacterium]|jgi:hypothetical protein|nr:hypothetical protein [Solirubrobacteraceae bacterium]